jgi:hypothetical protein
MKHRHVEEEAAIAALVTRVGRAVLAGRAASQMKLRSLSPYHPIPEIQLMAQNLP